MSKNIISGSLDVNVLLAFLFGTIFLSVMLYFAKNMPNPSGFSQWVFMVVTSLAGAGVGAVIPGIIKIDMPYVKAGGALAVFVLVLLNKPAIVGAVVKFVPPKESALPVASDYLSKIDSHLLNEAWDSLDAEAKDTIARDRVAYNQAYTNGRYPLGEISNRVPVGTMEVTSPSGFSAGIYRRLDFRTTFTSGNCYAEEVVLRAAEDIKWRTFNHTINPLPIPCF